MCVVVSDLTYVNIVDKWFYIYFIIDLFNREMIGYSSGPNKTVDLAQQALVTIEGDLYTVEIFHTDNGWTPEDFEGVYIVSSNKTELVQLTGNKISTSDDVITSARELVDTGIQNVLVKLGDKGSIFFNNDTVIKQKSYPVNAVDPTGAGDSYTSGSAKGLMEGLSIAESVKLRSKCGALTVHQLKKTLIITETF